MKRKNVTTKMMMGYIFESLLMLMAKKSYIDITIGEITNKAGVNRSTYYRNFSSKEDIVAFGLSAIIYELLDEYSKETERSEEKYLRTIFNCYYRHKKNLLLIHANGLSHLLMSTLNKVYEERFGNEGLPVDELYRRYYHIGGVYNFSVLWFSTGMENQPEEMTRIALSCFPENNTPKNLSRTV